LPLVYKLAIDIYDRRVAFVATAVLALSPPFLHEATEARPYAILTLGFVATLYAWRAALRTDQRRWYALLALATRIGACQPNDGRANRGFRGPHLARYLPAQFRRGGSASNVSFGVCAPAASSICSGLRDYALCWRSAGTFKALEAACLLGTPTGPLDLRVHSLDGLAGPCTGVDPDRACI
jgi:hypothetical protein